MSTPTTPVFTVGDAVRVFWPTWSDANDVMTVVSRTKCFVTFEASDGKTRRVKAHQAPDGEWARPYGDYSMAPTARAGR